MTRVVWAAAGFLTLTFAAAAAPITLTEALSRAAASDLAAPAANARIEAAQAGIRQAGRGLNPSLGIQVENFAGTRAYSMADRVETTLSAQQVIELGGKREARLDVARAELDVAHARRVVRKLDLLKDVQITWVEAVAAKAELELSRQRLAVTQSLRAEVDRRVRSARDPLFTGARSASMEAQARIDVDQAARRATAARAALAAYWQAGMPIEVDQAALESTELPALGNDASARVDLVLLGTERDAAGARTRVERARAIQDPTVHFGVRHLADSSAVAFVGGVSIPLPVRDINRDAIERAQAEHRAADGDLAAFRILQEREIARLRSRLEAGAMEARRIRTETIPEAERAKRLVREGFGRGGFSFIEVNEAERALADARARRIEVLKAYHLNLAQLDRLTSRHIAFARIEEPVR